MPRTAKTEAPKRTLTIQEREGLERVITDKESMLHATENFSEGNVATVIPGEISVNKDKLKADIARLKHTLDSESPHQATKSADIARIMKRRKELEDRFVPLLETRQDLGAIRMDSPEYKHAFDKAMKRPSVEAFISEWRELGKQLDPNDPSLIDLDRLRKDRD